MTDRAKKITELTALTNHSSDDLLVIVDSPANNAVTKKITVANFFANVSTNVTFKNTVTISNTLTVGESADFGAIYIDGSQVINATGYWVGSNSYTVTLTNPTDGDIFYYSNNALRNWRTPYNISSILPSARQYDLSVNSSVAANTLLIDNVTSYDVYALSGLTISFNILSTPGNSGIRIGNSSYGLTTVNQGFNLRHVSLNGTISYGNSAQDKTSGTLYFSIPSNVSGVYKIFTTNEQQFHYIYIKNIENLS